jgi:HEAT repeat protein
MSHHTDDELTLYYYGEAPRRDRIEDHLQACETCAATYRDVVRTLGFVGDLDVPERDERYGLEVWQRIRHDLPPQDAPWWAAWRRPAMMGAVVMLVVAAFAAGRFWPRSASSQDELQAANLSDVRGELREMREMLMLSLMQQQSATERLRGVSGSVQIDQPGTAIVRALLETLMHDPSANVRLACVGALRRFSEQDVVRQGTVQALAESSYPLVQIALIDFMVETKDKDAIDALRRLSQDSTVDEGVRGRAAWGVEQLSL